LPSGVSLDHGVEDCQQRTIGLITYPRGAAVAGSQWWKDACDRANGICTLRRPQPRDDGSDQMHIAKPIEPYELLATVFGLAGRIQTE
jgi:hypothetical protein